MPHPGTVDDGRRRPRWTLRAFPGVVREVRRADPSASGAAASSPGQPVQTLEFCVSRYRHNDESVSRDPERCPRGGPAPDGVTGRSLDADGGASWDPRRPAGRESTGLVVAIGRRPHGRQSGPRDGSVDGPHAPRIGPRGGRTPRPGCSRPSAAQNGPQIGSYAVPAGQPVDRDGRPASVAAGCASPHRRRPDPPESHLHPWDILPRLEEGKGRLPRRHLAVTSFPKCTHLRRDDGRRNARPTAVSAAVRPAPPSARRWGTDRATGRPHAGSWCPPRSSSRHRGAVGAVR